MTDSTRILVGKLIKSDKDKVVRCVKESKSDFEIQILEDDTVEVYKKNPTDFVYRFWLVYTGLVDTFDEKGS